MDTFDLVITGGRVIDPETGPDAVRNVGIDGGKIATITKKKDGQGDDRRHQLRGGSGFHRYASALRPALVQQTRPT